MNGQQFPVTGQVGTIYLVHFERPYRHAKHYLGWTGGTLRARFDRHTSMATIRRGSMLMRAVMQAGIGYKVVKTWRGDRALERRKKANGHASRCPVCRGEITYDQAVCQIGMQQAIARQRGAISPRIAGYLAILAFLIVLCAGCAWSPETRIEEGAFQAAHLADTLQTVTIVKHPREFRESFSSGLIGNYPTMGPALGLMGGEAVAHAAVTAALVHFGAPLWVDRSWQALTLVCQMGVVRANLQAHIDPW